jgi:hypothetical protein
MCKPVKYGYYSLIDTFTEDKGFSRIFESRIQAVNHAEIFKQVFIKDDVYIIDAENDIGTYFSTYTGNHLNKITIKKILEGIIYLPLVIILSPIVGFIMLKEKIFPPKYPNDFPQ